MKKNGKGKVAAKKIEKKATKPKVVRPLGKKTGKARIGWFLNFIRDHKEKLPSDEKILALAVEEFGKENVGSGCFTPARMRSWYNVCARAGRSGLTKKDVIEYAAK